MSSSSSLPAYTLVLDPYPKNEPYSVVDFQKSLEKGSDEEKISTMKEILVAMLEGNSMPELLMHVIRFVMPSKNKKLKKLLYFYWEIAPKLDRDGKLRHEMILVCNAIQHDLQHPNEYIRGNTLRFLTKLKEAELLEQMVPSVIQCLEYRHAYVRKYAILAVLSIYKVSEHLLPDAKEIINSFLAAETDPICKRNAFVGLSEVDREAALTYLEENIADIENLHPLLQSIFVEFIRKDATKTPVLKSQYVSLLLELLNSTTSNEVMFETSQALAVLTSDQQILTTVVRKLIDLAVRVSDNNIKLIVLDRIQDINSLYPGMLEEMSLDILHLLNAEDIDVRSKALDICMNLVTSRNAEDVVQLLKKELQVTLNNVTEKESNKEYRNLLIDAIRSIAVKFVNMSSSVISLLLDAISELNSVAAYGVVSFVKEVVELYPQLRSNILQQLIESMGDIKSAKAYRGALWIVGEYAETGPEIKSVWKHLRESLGEVPILQSELKKLNRAEDSEENSTEEVKKSTRPVILPDGTYATESAFGAKEDTKAAASSSNEERPPMRRFVLNGDFYTAAIFASTIVKLVLKFEKVSDETRIVNASKAEGLLMLVSIVRVGQSNLVEKKIDEDSMERLLTAISILMDESNPREGKQERELLDAAFLEVTKSSFQRQLSLSNSRSRTTSSKNVIENAEPIEKAISFRQFSKFDSAYTAKDSIEEDLELAIKGDPNKYRATTTISKLKKIIPLTGFSDPVYAEAYITNNQFNVVLDVLLVNQTKETLKNLHVQFATLGDLKIIDNPPATNVVPHGFHRIRATAKVSSADTGVIFGNIIYDGGHGEDARFVIMNDVQIDIMDYIKPATVDDDRFRTMWNEFEWENKISVKAEVPTLHDYLDALCKGTNMGVLTPAESLGEKDSRFLSCNLYARSSFGEDALANLCIEKDVSTGQVVGYVRIRSKGQGLALSLGDRVALITKRNQKVKLNRI